MRHFETDQFDGLDGNVPAGITDYLYSGSRCIEERNDSDTVLRQYVWGHYVDELMQLRELTGEKAGDYYPLTDLLHRAVALTDGAAKMVEAYDTDAYGWTLVFSGPGADGRWFTDDDVRTRPIGGQDLPAAPMCRYLYTGREYDAESRLYYCRGRYYSPELGRFISRDPIDYAGGMNLYEYVGKHTRCQTYEVSGCIYLHRTPQPKRCQVAFLCTETRFLGYIAA